MVPSKFYGIAAAGKPVLFIGGGQCEIAQIIRETGCGDCIEQGDVDVLTSVILHLQQNPAVLMDMGMRVRRIFDNRFTSVRAFRQWDLLLSKVISHELGDF